MIIMKNAKGLFTSNIFWIVLFSLLVIVCVIIIFATSHSPKSGKFAEIYSDNRLIRTVSLDKDDEFTVKSKKGYNIIRVRKGKISVIESDCKNKICINQGEVSNDLIPIVCVPNGLVIRIDSSETSSDYDAEI